jgi:hypothetical protein
MSIVVILSPW